MKLGLVTKLDKRNKTMSKKSEDDAMSTNCDVIVIFLIYGQFGAIQKLDPRCKICKIYIFINCATCYLKKTESRTKKLAHYWLIWVKVLFCQKMPIFSKKLLTWAKLRELTKKACFLKLHMCVYLCNKFQVSSIILTIFRQRRGEGR